MTNSMTPSTNPELDENAVAVAAASSRAGTFSALTMDEHRDLVRSAIRAYLSAAPAPAGGVEAVRQRVWSGVNPDGSALHPTVRQEMRELLASLSPAATSGSEAGPVAWVIPGDDTAKDNGFIDAMAWQEGEFTRPLYDHPALAKPSSPAGGWDAVAVKPLEWVEQGLSHSPTWRSESSFGRYLIYMRPNNSWAFEPPGLFGGKIGFKSPNEAMAAAQSDYEQRVRSALSPAATSGSEAGGDDVLEKDWACQAWGDGSSLPGDTNIVCPDCEVVIAANLPINIAIHIASLHNVALAKPASSPAGGDVREALLTARQAIWSGGDTVKAIAAIDAALSPSTSAAEPVAWIANCCHCGRIVDTREETEGGDKFGCELTDGRWTCSSECWDAVVEPGAAHPAPTAVESAQGVKELEWVRLGARAMQRMAQASCGNHSEGALEDAMTSAGLSKEDKTKLYAEADAADHISKDIRETVEDSALGYASYMGSDEDRKALAELGVNSNWLYRRKNGVPSKVEASISASLATEKEG